MLAENYKREELDRFDRAVRHAGIGGLVVLAFLVSVGGIALWATGTSDTKAEANQVFRAIVGVNPDNYSGIRFWSSSGIDFAYSFEFDFDGQRDINRILNAHGLLRRLLLQPVTVPIRREARRSCAAYSLTVDDVTTSLFVDYDLGTAYFEQFSI